jgi:exodeoxyribonuclease VIII
MKALNYSGAKEILKSPAHYQAWLKAEDEDTDALRIGRLVHLASLEPQVFDRQVRVMPECDRRTKDGKAVYEAFVATLKEGEECIKQKEMDLILGIAESAQCGIEKIADGKARVRVMEQVVTGKCEGIDIKGRPDLILHDSEGAIIIDVKTTADASPDAFSKDVAKFKYHLQAAFYMHMTGAKSFYFVAVEKKKPFAWAIYFLDEKTLEQGRQMMRSACLTYRESSLYNTWPGYVSVPKEISIPSYALRADYSEDA